MNRPFALTAALLAVPALALAQLPAYAHATGHVTAPSAAAPTAALSTVTYRMSGYANIAREMARWQLGVVHINGSGSWNASGAADGTTHTVNEPKFYAPVDMTTRVIGMSTTIAAHDGPKTVVLDVIVTSSTDDKNCVVGTEGHITLVDDNRKLANGQTRDSIRQDYPPETCPSFIQGFNNIDATRFSPPTGGRGGGQWARVTVRYTAAP